MSGLLSVSGAFQGEFPVSLVQANLFRPYSKARTPVPASGGPSINRDAVLAEHMGLVQAIARREHARLPPHMCVDDLVSAGTLGLLDAADRFDGSKGVQFRSYAQFRIRGAILDFLRDGDWSSRDQRRVHRAIEAAKERLTGKLGRGPADWEVAEAMGIELGVYQQRLVDCNRLMLGNSHAESESEARQEELASVPGPVTDDPLLQLLAAEKRDRLRTLIDGLAEKERLVLCLYYYEELTLKEIGGVLGLSDSAVSELRTSALAKLRRQMQPSRAPQVPSGTGKPKRTAGVSRRAVTSAEVSW